jgi:hypothetical protein
MERSDMTRFITIERQTNEPKPATGQHLALLGDLEHETRKLLRLVEAERSGTYDGLGHRFWTGSDAVLTAAEKLVWLAQQRVGCISQ